MHLAPYQNLLSHGYIRGVEMIKIQGHRGFSELYPENTMTAFRKCYESGASAIEMDVRNTSDNQLVIIHDATIDRTSNGSGNVANMTLTELKTYDFGSWFSPEFAGEKILTLDEVIEEFKDKDITLVLHCYPNSTEMLYAIADKPDNAGILHKIMLFGEISFINALKKYKPNAMTLNGGQPNIDTYQSFLDNAVVNGHEAVSINANETTANLQTMIANIKAQGKQVHASYISSNYEAALDKHISLGTDYILGNNPAIMQNYVYGEQPGPGTPISLYKSNRYVNTESGKVKANMYVKTDNGLIKASSYQAL